MLKALGSVAFFLADGIFYLTNDNIEIDFNDRYEQAYTYHNLGIVAQKQGQWQ